MQIQLAKQFEAQVGEAARKMVAEKLDVCEIPGSSGMVLVRIGSPEYEHRLQANLIAMIIPIPVTVNGNHFVIC